MSMTSSNGATTGQQAPAQTGTASEWAAYHLAAAIRHLADAVREGLLALAKAVKSQK